MTVFCFNFICRLSDGLHPFASSFALRSCEMTEFPNPSIHNDHRLSVSGGSRRTPLNRSSFSSFMVTTSLMADDSDTQTHSYTGGSGGGIERGRDHSSSARKFFKRKFSIGSTD